jgi:hypothetical protein
VDNQRDLKSSIRIIKAGGKRKKGNLWANQVSYLFHSPGKNITDFAEQGPDRLFRIGYNRIALLLIQDLLHAAAMNSHLISLPFPRVEGFKPFG